MKIITIFLAFSEKMLYLCGTFQKNMDYLFYEDLQEAFSNSELAFREIKRDNFIDTINYDSFPMICYEETNDSDVSLWPEESSFLTNDMYEDNWYVIANGDDDCVSLINMFVDDTELKIEVMELNKELRGTGLGRHIVETIESVAERYGISRICLSPFDTDAMNFWHHMGYKEDSNFNFEKILD